MQQRVGHSDRARVARGRALRARELHAEALREQVEATELAAPQDIR